MLPSSGYSLVILTVGIIFRPYYFVKLFGSINSRKSICQNHIYFLNLLFFIIEGNLLCCTKIKVTGFFPNKEINFSNDCNKPPAFQSIHYSVE